MISLRLVAVTVGNQILLDSIGTWMNKSVLALFIA